MQQDPAALVPSLTSGLTSAADSSGGAGLPGDTSSSPASFSDALSSALASATGSSTDTSSMYTDPTTDASLTSSDPSSELSSLLATNGTLGTAGSVLATGGTSGSAPAQVQAMTNMANSLIGKPYIYGGGHSGWGAQAGYDCSGFVSAVLHAGGFLSSPQNTQTLPGQPGIESGPGQYVTIYDRNTGPTDNEHVIIEINGQFYESGGEAGSWGGGGGVEKIATPSQSYLSSFTTILHPAGL
jgi:cell wall-associated NlpC family hydrolase